MNSNESNEGWFLAFSSYNMVLVGKRNKSYTCDDEASSQEGTILACDPSEFETAQSLAALCKEVSESARLDNCKLKSVYAWMTVELPQEGDAPKDEPC